MNLINKQVMHKRFGKGNVIKHSDTVVEIHFVSGNKKFIFPDAFVSYLILTDEKSADEVNNLIQKNEINRLKEKLGLDMEKAQHNKEQQYLLEWEKQVASNKIHPSSQAAFWCEAEDKNKIFTEWKVFTGLKKSGINEGQPNRPMRMHQNSACLLTERDPQMPEKDRCISGVYMVNETFSGRQCDDGYIPAHSKYKISLSEQESKKMLFWKYYVNERFPLNMTWNSGTYRYLENIHVAQILRDIISIKSEPKERESVQNFYEHFCRMNQIIENELPEPKGALLRIKPKDK